MDDAQAPLSFDALKGQVAAGAIDTVIAAQVEMIMVRATLQDTYQFCHLQGVSFAA